MELLSLAGQCLVMESEFTDGGLICKERSGREGSEVVIDGDLIVGFELEGMEI